MPVPSVRPSAALAAAGRWRGETAGALNATAAMLPFVLTFGAIVFGSAGAGTAQMALMASVLAVVLGGAVMVVLGRAPLPTASPSASTSLILGSLVLTLLQDPALQPATPAAAARLLACTGATVMFAGLLLLLLGALRAGRLVRFVPQPVLAGFMNGVAVLIVSSQVPALLGLSVAAWKRDGLAALADASPVPLGVAAITGLAVWLVGRWLPRWPAPMLVLLLGTLAVFAAEHSGLLAAPGSAWMLQRLGDLNAAWPLPTALGPWLDDGTRALLQPHLGTMAVTALLLALIGGLESVLNLAGVDQVLDVRTDPDRELLALGASNLVVSLFGGLFLVYLRLRAVATYQGGGRTWRSVGVGCAMLLAVFALALPVVEQVPTAVVAGIVVMLAWTLVDPWTRERLRQWWRGPRSAELHLSLAVVALVFAITLMWGFVAGVAAGVVVSVLIFIRALNRSLLRSRYLATDMPSRRIYPNELAAPLARLRERIEVFELEGALFFGNFESLMLQAQSLAATRAFLVLDLRRVSTLDESAALGLVRLRERLARRATTLLLAGVTPANRQGLALQSHGVALDALQAHPDADHALEAAELSLLAQNGQGPFALQVPPAQCSLLQGLSRNQTERVCELLQRRELDAGTLLFKQGDPGDALYLLERGSISVRDRVRAQRFVSFSPGMCFGETAVLDGEGRTADAIADLPSTVHALPAQVLQQLATEDPALAALLYLNLARHLSERLRSAAAAWRQAAA